MVRIQIGEEFREVTPEALREALKEQFPAGDPAFQQITWTEQELYNAKNHDYAGGGEDPNGNFIRVATIFALYPGLRLSDPRVYAWTLAMKQVDQMLWSLSRGFEGQVEGLQERLADVHVYAKIVRMLDQHMGEEQTLEDQENHCKPGCACRAKEHLRGGFSSHP